MGAGNGRKTLEIDAQRVGGGAGDDQLRLVLARLGFHGVIIDLFLGIEAVGDDVEPLARHVQRHAVGQVAALGQAHAHDRVTRLQQAEEHRLVGLRAGVGLHVGGFGAGSEFSWQAIATYNSPLCEIRGIPVDGYVGFRALSADFSQGSGRSRFEFDNVIYGPVIGATMRF